VVTIAERIHLFPFRTQKLSSLALMVLGGKLPGRVRRSHVVFFSFCLNIIRGLMVKFRTYMRTTL
jgi:hypothetical protein